jgi:hypothetical protein
MRQERADLQSHLERLPLIAILRGVRPDEVVAIGEALVDAGFAIIEVPFDSPGALDSIRRLHHAFGFDVFLGAGTVMTPSDTRDVAAAGGQLVVMPHADADVIRAAISEGLACIPGIATPTEGFSALAHGSGWTEAVSGGVAHADGIACIPCRISHRYEVLSCRRHHPQRHGRLRRRRSDGFWSRVGPLPAWRQPCTGFDQREGLRDRVVCAATRLMLSS